MVVENLTQRSGDTREEIDNLCLIRKHLKKTNRSPSERLGNPPQGGGRLPESGSVIPRKKRLRGCLENIIRGENVCLFPSTYPTHEGAAP